MSDSNYLKEYWCGYNACKHDIAYGGIEFACFEYMHGLNGVTDTYARGYRACLYKYIP